VTSRVAIILCLVGLLAAGCAAADAAGQGDTPTAVTAELGQAAPAFTLTDLDGNDVSLSDFAGKTVVLEWFNPDCPFVRYAHGPKGPLWGAAARHQEQGVVWLAINSGAPGKQGHGVDRNRKARTEYGMTHAILLDEDGAVGRVYGARTTPHLYVIDAAGTLVYRGALDNAPLGNPKGKPVNYLDEALSDCASGVAVRTSDTKAYGCSVKYGS